MTKFKVTLLTSIGAGLEYYDFVIYALLATYLSTLFFANEDTLTNLLKTFAIFAIGYVVRPLGGLLFGYLGDRFGRKKNFIITLFLMAFATLAIGLLPTYQNVGVAAPLLLILCRTLQGIAYGAEMPGAITFITEHSHTHHRGFSCSMMLLGVAFGVSFATLLLTLLTSILSQQHMLDFGWRIPFLIGGILAIIGGVMRRQIEETPLFIQSKPNRTPLKILLKSYRKECVIGIGLPLLAGSLLLFYLYLPTYLHQFFNYSLSDAYRASTIGTLISALLLPLFGYLSDHVGRKRQLQLSAFITLLGIYSLFNLVSVGTFISLIFFVAIYQIIIAALAACYPTMLAELFPTEVRYSGVALCYNVAFALAGLIPMLANYLLQTSKNPLSVSFLIGFIAILTMVASFYVSDKTRQQLI